MAAVLTVIKRVSNFLNPNPPTLLIVKDIWLFAINHDYEVNFSYLEFIYET